MKFKTNPKGGPAIVTVGIILLFAIALTSPDIKLFDLGFLLLVFIACLIGLDIFFGNYVFVTDNKVCVVDLFLYKRCVEMAYISGINYGPQFAVGVGAKVLFLRGDVNGGRIRAGPGRLNNFSASISGASAGVTAMLVSRWPRSPCQNAVC